MPDARLTELAAVSSLDEDDILYVVEDGVGKKVTVAELRSAVYSDGWAEDDDTWTYASATTFTIAGVDRTSRFRKGTRVRLKQGGSYKYLAVVGSSFSTDTTVTVFGGSDYSLANAAITDNAYSWFALPPGYPESFAYPVVWETDSGSVSIGNGTMTGTWMCLGNRAMQTIAWAAGSTTTFGGGGWRFPCPVAPAGTFPGKGNAQGIDSASTQYLGLCWTDGANLRISGDGSWAAWWDNNFPFTWGSGDVFNAELDYRF